MIVFEQHSILAKTMSAPHLPCDFFWQFPRKIEKKSLAKLGRTLFWRECCVSQKHPLNITMPLVFDDSQNAGGDKGAPPEWAFIASSASYLCLRVRMRCKYYLYFNSISRDCKYLCDQSLNALVVSCAVTARNRKERYAINHQVQVVKVRPIFLCAFTNYAHKTICR